MLNRAVQSVGEEHLCVFGRPGDGMLFFMGRAVKISGLRPSILRTPTFTTKITGLRPWISFGEDYLNEPD
ncbi:hypothetical protein [Lunatibacter salilacus]|uniref:hypothetical protein n=1 Tax=Lunatibacter salilacus TaxID=2483804 RepID=UPI00131B0083|nr:hypothetical protein [Lunatibacter salilacus]